MIDKDELFDDVIGGGELAKDKIREDIVPPRGLTAFKPTSQLDKNIVRLLTLHPQIEPQFRNHSLAGLDEETKQALLEDIQTVLGITPLLKR